MDDVSSSTNTAEQTTEIYVKKILPGSVETVRSQIAAAIETLGYDVLEDESHIVARRGARGWATWYGSADVLDYAMTLVVRFKAIGANSTRATFDYVIKHPWLNRGEKNILVQEAQTIAALSKKQALEKICSVCETESTDDSRFCRRCGAPLASEQAELEVLRMMAEIRAGKTSVVAASILTVVSMALFLVSIYLYFYNTGNPNAFRFPLVFAALSILSAIYSSAFGWYRLKRALEKPDIQTRNSFQNVSSANSLSTGEFDELPPRRAPAASITEGTTNLLDHEWTNRRDEEKIPISKRRNTNSFE